MKSLLPLVLLPLLMVLVLAVGTTGVDFSAVWQTLLGEGGSDSAEAFIILQMRLPRLVTAVLAGCSLAAAGLVMQTVFGNPLADPSILGVNAGAGVGAAVAILLLGGSAVVGSAALGGYVLTMALAAVGAVGVTLLLMGLSAAFRSNLHLLVAGVMVSFAASSVTSILSYFSPARSVQSYVVWGMGDFGSTSWQSLPLFAVVVAMCLVILFLEMKSLNALLLGGNYARGLGVRVRRVRGVLLLACGVLCAATTALCGPIAFIGLAAPHAARFFHRTADHRRLLPLTLLWGADVALLASLIAHLPGLPLLPVNAVMPLIGVPVVMALLLRRRVE